MIINDLYKDILIHTLGLDRHDRPYRNHYCASPENDGWEDLVQMVDLGLLTRRDDPLSSLQVFHATDKAICLLDAKKQTTLNKEKSS